MKKSFDEKQRDCKHEKVWVDPQSNRKYCKECGATVKDNKDFPEKGDFLTQENGGFRENKNNGKPN